MPLPLLASTLTVVQGATVTRVMQIYAEDGSVPTQFLGSDVLTGTVWLAENEPAIVTFTPTWFNAASAQVTVSVLGPQTAMLAIDTTYNLQVFVTRDGVSYCVIWAYLQVLPTAGSQSPASPPDLISGAYCAQMLQALLLSGAQLEQVPQLITAASQAVRRWCGDRDFSQLQYTEEYTVAWDGRVRLNQIPVNQVLRVQGELDDAIQVTLSNPQASNAWAQFAITGDYTSGQTITGLNLVSIIGGVQATASIPWASLPNGPSSLISALGTAIDAAGSGWACYVNSQYGGWSVSELTGFTTAKGAIYGLGAVGQVYSEDLPNASLHDQTTGMLYVGRQYRGLGPRWGPDWPVFDAPAAAAPSSQVKVTYSAGFATIPPVVQLATAELVKWQLERLKTDTTLQSESAGQYSYSLVGAISALPLYVQKGLAQYRLTSA